MLGTFVNRMSVAMMPHGTGGEQPCTEKPSMYVAIAKRRK